MWLKDAVVCDQVLSVLKSGETTASRCLNLLLSYITTE